MYNFAIYDEIQDKYEEDKKLFNEKFKINTTFSLDKSSRQEKEIEPNYFIDSYNKRHYIFKVDDNKHTDNINKINNLYTLDNQNIQDDGIFNSESLIDRMYAHCYKEAYVYSWNNISSNYLHSFSTQIYSTFENMQEIYKQLFSTEKIIREHCAIASLYTVQYLLNKDKTVTAPELASRVQRKGHNQYLEELELGTVTKNYEKNASGKINGIIEDINNNKDHQSESYLGQIVDASVKEGTKYVPLFLSNFSFAIMNNLNKFNAYDKLEKIEQENKSEKLRYKIDSFINSYLMSINDFVCDDKSTVVDKILFYYQKERVFNFELMKSCFIGEDLNDSTENLLLDDTSEIDLIKECMKLPNAFSKTEFVKLFNKETISYFSINPTNIIKKLNSVVFPTYEKLFFITLYEYFNGLSLSKNEILEHMNVELTNYFENNRAQSIDKVINYHSSKPSLDIENVKNKKGILKPTEKVSTMYKLVEHFINNVKFLDENTNIDYESMDANINDRFHEIILGAKDSEFIMKHF